VVHLAHATSQFLTVMGAVWLPSLAVTAVSWSPVLLAHKHVAAIKGFQSRTIRIEVRPGVVRLAFEIDVISPPRFPPPCATSSSLSVSRRRAEWYQTWIEGDRPERSQVCRKREAEEQEVQHEEHDCRPGLAPHIVDIIDCANPSQAVRRIVREYSKSTKRCQETHCTGGRRLRM
jgi:hypothetical protein